jgi:PAS domain S-box-containing protein
MLWVLVAAVVPSIVLLAVAAVRQRAESVERIEREVTSVAESSASVIAESVGQVRVVLSALAREEAIVAADPERCRKLFRDWQDGQPHLHELGIAAADGRLLASTLPEPEGVAAIERPWLQRALESGELSIGALSVDDSRAAPSIHFAVPVAARDGTRNVLFAAVDPGWLVAPVVRTGVPEGLVRTVVDAKGTVLVQQPEGEGWLGRSAAAAPNVAALLAGSHGLAELAGTDGVRRIYSLQPAVTTPGGGLFVAVGVERSLAYATADRGLIAALIGMVVAVGLSLAAAWFVADRTVLSRIRRMIEAARAIEAGDESIRVGDTGRDELAELAQAFDAAAAGLQSRAQGELDRQSRLRAIVDTAIDAIVTIDSKGVIESVNPATTRLLGYREDEVIGRKVDLLMPEPYRSEHDGYMRRYLTTGEARIIGIGREVVARRKDGTLFPVELSVTEFRLGSERMFTGMLRDITARKQAEDEVRRLNSELEARVEARTAQLEAVNRELEAFSYSVSHDLRAPLRHINGFVNLLRENLGPKLDERSSRHMATIQAASARMGALIDDILAFSRVGRAEMRRQQVDLEAVVRGAWDEVRADAGQRKIRFDLAPLPSIEGDPTMLRQVFTNLLANAVKFTREREEATIGVGSEEGEDGDVIVHVRDNGVGFDPKYAGKLFGVFQRLHSAEQFEGTGIGLAIVQRVVQRHGGTVGATSEPQSGATFSVRLPRRAPE